MESDAYFEKLISGVRTEYAFAGEARRKGLDPADKVESMLALSLAEKAVGLIATIYPQLMDTTAIVERILELEKQYGQLDIAVSFKIADEVAHESFCKFKDKLEAIDAGIRVGFAYTTLGVVSSPIEGYTGIKLGKTRDGGDYFKAYFSGPIRSAGTTAGCVALMLIDYLRDIFGYAKFDPDDREVKRYVTENYDYHERVNNLQYLPTEEEILFLAKNLPIEVTGDPTEDREVSNYKDLPRVETNAIRGGMCLIFSEGLAQKAQKALRLWRSLQKNNIPVRGWEFLDDYIPIHKKREKGTKDTTATYMKDLVAGRPVFGHPSAPGSFRLRYGRSRIAGFSATSIHPATMAISNCFLASGTQLKIEKPTKGCVVTVCDSIEGPIVKMKSGSVRKLSDFDEAKKAYTDVEEIIYFGDILFPLGDVMNRNYELLKSGFVEEWWGLELKKKADEAGDKLAVDSFNVSLEDAMALSKKYGLPLHPKYIYYWTQISKEQFFAMLDWLKSGMWRDKVVLQYERSARDSLKNGKRALELLGVEHDVILDNVVLKDGRDFLVNLGIDLNTMDYQESVDELLKKFSEKMAEKPEVSVLELINLASKFPIKDRAGTFIGSRMGRPEKAKLRKLDGSPNTLFTVGEQGGRFRSLNEAVEKGFIQGEFPSYFCGKCSKDTIYRVCEDCGSAAEKRFYCPECGMAHVEECGRHEKGRKFGTRSIDSKHYFERAVQKLGLKPEEMPKMIKGVRGTMNDEHVNENIAKGILRAKHNLCVNKDGTVRYDASEIPVTHFKPHEVAVSIEKLREIGYVADIFGKNLENDEQILELMPHDVILPACPDSDDQGADEVFVNIAGFIDDLLEKFYGLPRYYNVKTREDLVGKLVSCMSPHNCAGVVGRIVGFSKIQGLLASPYMHAAMRRDCDGDEAAVMLLMDVLLNFSRKFLPSHRGGTQDAPLVLNSRISAGEVDDQILDFEVCASYPLELYHFSEQGKHSSEVKIETVKTRLRNNLDPFSNIGFTHNTTDFNAGVVHSAYKSLPTMRDKVLHQMDLVKKIRAVDASDVARLMIERHFIRDIRGNLRKFSQQQFRCVTCNEKFRRPPMSGVCTKCGGKILFTISEGSIRKYLEPAFELAVSFDIPSYTKESLELAREYIDSIFGREAEKQVVLQKWF